MVKLKVTARVVPEGKYTPGQTSTPAGKKFLVIVRDPDEFYYVGTLAREIQNQYQRLYKHELGKVKYLKDDGDNDLDPEQLVLDVFVNEGKAERDGLDQDASITVIQDQRQALRLGSVVPDLTPVHYLPRPKPPIPRFSEVPSTLGKRLRQDPAIQGAPGHSKRSKQFEIAQTQQDDTNMLRSIEQSPELVNDTQSSSHHHNLGTDQDGHMVKAESPTLRREIRDIEPATGDELQWLSERPPSFVSLRKPQARPPRDNGLARASDIPRDSPLSRRSQLPMTPPTDPFNLAPPVERNQSTGSAMHQPLSTSGRKFKQSSRRNIYDVPVESDIEDSQINLADQSPMVPRLVKNISTIEEIPSRQTTDDDIVFDPQVSFQPMEIDKAELSVPSKNNANLPVSSAEDDDSEDDADATYTSAKASTSHGDGSRAATTSAAQTEDTTTSSEASDSEEKSSSGSSASDSAISVAAKGTISTSTGNKDKNGEETDAKSESSENDQKESETDADTDNDSESESAPAFETQNNTSRAIVKETQMKKAIAKDLKELGSSADIGKTVSGSLATDQTRNAVASPPPKRGRGRPPKNISAPISARHETPAKSRTSETVDGSMQKKSAKRGPMSKLVNGAFSRRNSESDSPGEQLSQSLRESANIASIPETIQDQVNGNETKGGNRANERRPSNSSATSTPSRERIGLGITDSPRKSKSLSVEVPTSPGKPPLALKLQQMRRSSASAAASAKGVDKQEKVSTTETNGSGSQAISPSKRKRLNKLAKKEKEVVAQQSPNANVASSISAVQQSPKAPPLATQESNGPVLPKGMTLEQYNAMRSESNITEEEYRIRKAEKLKTKPKTSQVPQVVVSVEASTNPSVPQSIAAPTNARKVGRPKKERNDRLDVTEAHEKRATSSPSVEAFTAISARLNSIQPSDKGSMPPPDINNTSKKRSPVDHAPSVAGRKVNGNRVSAVDTLLSSSAKPAAPFPVENKSAKNAPKQGPASKAPAKQTPRPSSAKAAPTVAAFSNTPNGGVTTLSGLKAKLAAERASNNASPAPQSAKQGFVGASRILQMMNNGEDSSSSSDSSDDDDDDDAGGGVAKGRQAAERKQQERKAVMAVDTSIRDPTPEDSDSD